MLNAPLLLALGRIRAPISASSAAVGIMFNSFGSQAKPSEARPTSRAANSATYTCAMPLPL